MTQQQIMLNPENGVFKVKQFKFLGHILSAEGEKLKTLKSFRNPQTREELSNYLGLITYIGRFLPQLGHKKGNSATASKR